MPPVDGQAHHDNRMPPGLAIGVLGRALIFARVLLWLLLLLGILPLALLWRLFTRRRVWPQIYFRGFCAVMGVRLRVHGTPGGNALYLPNHMSWMDIPAILAASGSAFVANDGLARSPLFRLLAGMNDTVFIARHRRATIGAQVADVRRAVIDAGALTIFIEGTTSDGSRLLPFKSALLSALEPLPEGLTVQPVMLRYAEGAAVAWVGNEPGLNNVRRMLARVRPIRIDIHFLEPLAGAALASRKTIAAAAHDAIAARMGIG